jgi:hypothetical protein
MPRSLRSLPVLCLLGSLALPAICSADDFRTEVGFDLDRTEFDGPGAPEAESYALGGTYFFAPVNTDGVPLAEAPFLRRSSFVNGGLVRAELGDEKIDILALNVGYYLPGTIFYGRIGAAYFDDFGGDQTDVNATLGVAPLDGLLVTTDFDEDGWDPNLTARYVGKLPNAHFYAGRVSLVDPDGGDTYFALDFDYYLDTATSVGAGYSDGDDRLELRARKFFSESWAAGISAFTADGADGFGVNLVWRN